MQYNDYLSLFFPENMKQQQPLFNQLNPFKDLNFKANLRTQNIFLTT